MRAAGELQGRLISFIQPEELWKIKSLELDIQKSSISDEDFEKMVRAVIHPVRDR
jgi:hypothetical protein